MGTFATSVAVLGAGGFIGGRVTEVLHLNGWTVRPVTRRPDAALAARFGAAARVADALEADVLSRALQDCEVVVHALAGDLRTIRRSTAPVYRAAKAAGCRRIVHLSTAVVHGQAPPADTDESTPLPRGQRLPYNVAKLAAERELFGLAAEGDVEVAVLRPGIVFGPRSRWIAGLADDLLAGRAGLVDGGHGLCNGIYVDNVAHAVELAAASRAAAGQAFLIGDDEQPTWREFYRRVADPLGLRGDDIPVLRFDGGWAWLGKLGRSSAPKADYETALLHRAAHAPRWDKAAAVLGYRPAIPPEEAWRRTLDWLAQRGDGVTSR